MILPESCKVLIFSRVLWHCCFVILLVGSSLIIWSMPLTEIGLVDSCVLFYVIIKYVAKKIYLTFAFLCEFVFFNYYIISWPVNQWLNAQIKYLLSCVLPKSVLTNHRINQSIFPKSSWSTDEFFDYYEFKSQFNLSLPGIWRNT